MTRKVEIFYCITQHCNWVYTLKHEGGLFDYNVIHGEVTTRRLRRNQSFYVNLTTIILLKGNVQQQFQTLTL